MPRQQWHINRSNHHQKQTSKVLSSLRAQTCPPCWTCIAPACAHTLATINQILKASIPSLNLCWFWISEFMFSIFEVSCWMISFSTMSSCYQHSILFAKWSLFWKKHWNLNFSCWWSDYEELSFFTEDSLVFACTVNASGRKIRNATKENSTAESNLHCPNVYSLQIISSNIKGSINLAEWCCSQSQRWIYFAE